MEMDFQQFENEIFYWLSVWLQYLNLTWICNKKNLKENKMRVLIGAIVFYVESVFFASMGKLTKNSRLKNRLLLQIHQNQFLSV